MAEQRARQLQESLAQSNSEVAHLQALTSELQRYREITEQYRALSGVGDSRRDRQSAPLSSREISHIQNAIALTEEDLRQIHSLDAQVQRLEKKLPTK